MVATACTYCVPVMARPRSTVSRTHRSRSSSQHATSSVNRRSTTWRCWPADHTQDKRRQRGQLRPLGGFDVVTERVESLAVAQGVGAPGSSASSTIGGRSSNADAQSTGVGAHLLRNGRASRRSVRIARERVVMTSRIAALSLRCVPPRPSTSRPRLAGERRASRARRRGLSRRARSTTPGCGSTRRRRWWRGQAPSRPRRRRPHRRSTRPRPARGPRAAARPEERRLGAGAGAEPGVLVLPTMTARRRARHELAVARRHRSAKSRTPFVVGSRRRPLRSLMRWHAAQRAVGRPAATSARAALVAPRSPRSNRIARRSAVNAASSTSAGDVTPATRSARPSASRDVFVGSMRWSAHSAEVRGGEAIRRLRRATPSTTRPSSMKATMSATFETSLAFSRRAESRCRGPGAHGARRSPLGCASGEPRAWVRRPRARRAAGPAGASDSICCSPPTGTGDRLRRSRGSGTARMPSRSWGRSSSTWRFSSTLSPGRCRGPGRADVERAAGTETRR